MQPTSIDQNKLAREVKLKFDNFRNTYLFSNLKLVSISIIRS